MRETAATKERTNFTPCVSRLWLFTGGGAHVAAADVADAGLEADHAVAQAVHDGLALPRHALARIFIRFRV